MNLKRWVAAVLALLLLPFPGFGVEAEATSGPSPGNLQVCRSLLRQLRVVNEQIQQLEEECARLTMYIDKAEERLKGVKTAEERRSLERQVVRLNRARAFKRRVRARARAKRQRLEGEFAERYQRLSAKERAEVDKERPSGASSNETTGKGAPAKGSP